MKAEPLEFRDALPNKTLVMLFEKPSLRTRVSFEVGMTQLGGHAIFYSVADAPLGKKETLSDTAKVLSRFATFVMARVNKRSDIAELAELSTVPVINGLDDFAHPCQILTDLQTIEEKKGRLQGIKMAYLGDCQNNMTYDLMRACCLLGMEIRVAGPAGEAYEIEHEVLDECTQLCAAHGGTFRVCETAEEAVGDADVVYTDSWMSYGVSAASLEERINKFSPFRVTASLMALAADDAIFMNCLPAMRGMEQDADVIDGPQSVVFDQAENRLHAQKERRS